MVQVDNYNYVVSQQGLENNLPTGLEKRGTYLILIKRMNFPHTF